jgi:hypothetical protein
VATVVISDSSGNVILAVMQRLSSTDVFIGETSASLTKLADSTGVENFSA